MSKWEMVKLGEVASYVNGYAFKPNDWSENGLPIIRIQDLTGNAYKTNYYDGVLNEKYLINKGDVLISWSASLGVYEWKKSKALLNQHIFKVVFDKVNIDKVYFSYAVKKRLHTVDNDVHGSTMKHITKGRFDNLVIPLPPLETQKKIADELDKITNLIEKRKTQIEKLDLLVKAKFIEMFGDPVLNPMGWEVEKWQDVLNIKNGRNQKKVESPYGEYPIYGSGGIMAYANNYICNENSVVIGRKGNINKPILVKQKYWNVDTAFGLEPIAGVLVCEYLYYFCIWFNFEQLNKTVTIPSLTKNDLLALKMPIPSFELQSKFAEFVEATEKTKETMQKALNQLETLYKQRMQEYFE